MLKRYGLSTKKMESNLRLYLAILGKEGIVPTFPITADVVNRHPESIKKLRYSGVEFAIHGYKHIDCTQLPDGEFLKHVQKAIEVFQETNVPVCGFRFPYLKWNAESIRTLVKLSLKWDSSHAVLWDVIPKTRFNKRSLSNFESMLRRYNYKNAESCITLPRVFSNIIEIPVSLPDDDLLERLGIMREVSVVAKIWGEILNRSYLRGELFALQLHPERISFYEEALKSLVETSNRLFPKIWMTSLGGIAEWWDEKGGFSFEIEKRTNEEYEIHANSSERATILVKTRTPKKSNFPGHYKLVRRKDFRIKSLKRPIIGVSESCSPNLLQFLKNEGFVFEICRGKSDYSVILSDFEFFGESDEIKVTRIIENSRFPLIRFWRWPNELRSAFAVTGDIDGLTHLDFFSRFFYR